MPITIVFSEYDKMTKQQLIDEKKELNRLVFPYDNVKYNFQERRMRRSYVDRLLTKIYEFERKQEEYIKNYKKHNLLLFLKDEFQKLKLPILKNEHDLQILLYGLFLSFSSYEDIKIENPHRFQDGSYIDFFINDMIGIEVKFNPTKGELDRLTGQLCGYRKYCKVLFAFILTDHSLQYKHPDTSIGIMISLQHQNELKINAKQKSKNHILPSPKDSQ